MNNTSKSMKTFKFGGSVKTIMYLKDFINSNRIIEYFDSEGIHQHEYLPTSEISKMNYTMVAREGDYIIMRSKDNPYLVTFLDNNMVDEPLETRIFEVLEDALQYIYSDIIGKLLITGYVEVV